jgi:hypothetical protein
MGTERRRTIINKEVYSKYPRIKSAVDNINIILEWLHRNFTFAELIANSQDNRKRKEANEFMDYQREERRAERPLTNDKVFPLETVSIQEYNTKYDAGIEKVTIHTGPAADEYARSMDALAITIATDIYFRNNKYNPADEEGRKLLAHEMTHIAQHEEGRITSVSEEKELENEAVRAESKAVYKDDPVVTIKIGDELFRFRRSKMKIIVNAVAEDINKWVETRRGTMNEEEYLKFLCFYERWLKEVI